MVGAARLVSAWYRWQFSGPKEEILAPQQAGRGWTWPSACPALGWAVLDLHLQIPFVWKARKESCCSLHGAGGGSSLNPAPVASVWGLPCSLHLCFLNFYLFLFLKLKASPWDLSILPKPFTSAFSRALESSFSVREDYAPASVICELLTGAGADPWIIVDPALGVTSTKKCSFPFTWHWCHPTAQQYCPRTGERG